MRVLVTGSNGFLGRNLVLRLQEAGYAVDRFTRGDPPDSLPSRVRDADAVFHLAGVNRPTSPEEFSTVNLGLTESLADAVAMAGHAPIIVFASSTHATIDSPYGNSKRAAEMRLERLALAVPSPIFLFRLPGVFGKWGRPDYNSVVNTFCHHVANNLAIRVDDPNRSLRLVYVEDVVDAFIACLERPEPGLHRPEVEPSYGVTLGFIAAQISAFRNCRTTLMSEPVGNGLVRALYSTYVSYLPTSDFRYPLTPKGDARGRFVEMLRTRDSGQFSFFTAHPGITRGGHYHHSKTEKFLVVKGTALFRFRNILSDERVEFTTDGQTPEVVETSPGWAHDVTNVGDDELIVMLWANETFDPAKPDTVSSVV